MKHFVNKKEVVMRLHNTTCDKCGADTYEGTFNGDYYEFSFKREQGVAYPEYQNYEIEEMNLCADCSKELVLNLESLGYKINRSEVDN